MSGLLVPATPKSTGILSRLDTLRLPPPAFFVPRWHGAGGEQIPGVDEKPDVSGSFPTVGVAGNAITCASGGGKPAPPADDDGHSSKPGVEGSSAPAPGVRGVFPPPPPPPVPSLPLPKEEAASSDPRSSARRYAEDDDLLAITPPVEAPLPPLQSSLKKLVLASL